MLPGWLIWGKSGDNGCVFVVGNWFSSLKITVRRIPIALGAIGSLTAISISRVEVSGISCPDLSDISSFRELTDVVLSAR